MDANCMECRNGQHEKIIEKLSEQQVEILEAAYSQWPQPFPELLDQLVKETAMKPKELSEWFWQKNKTKITDCFNRQVKPTHVDQHGRQTKKEDSNVLAKSKSVESRNSLKVGMNRTKINVKTDDVKKHNENYSSVKIKPLKKRPTSKVSDVTLKKIGLNQQKKSNDSVEETKDSQNIMFSKENDEIDTECEFCPEYFRSRTKLFVHMMIHVPPGIKEKLPKEEGERAWCVHCPGPVPVEQVNSHVAKCHIMEVEAGDIDMKDTTEGGFEVVENKCDELSLVESGIPNLMVESAPVVIKFIPEECGNCIANLEEIKLFV